MAYKYENHGKIFKEEKDRADQYEKLYTELKQPYDDIKKEAHRLKLNLVKYEQKYGFIDIGKLHEQVASSTTKFEAAKKEAASYHKDLIDLKKQIMQATQKFDRGNQGEGGKKNRKRREDDEAWKGSEDVEKLASGTLAVAADSDSGPKETLNERLHRIIHHDSIVLFMKGIPQEPKCKFR